MVPNTVIELEDVIEEMFEEQKTKRGKPSKEWKERINILIRKTNQLTKITIYKEVV